MIDGKMDELLGTEVKIESVDWLDERMLAVSTVNGMRIYEVEETLKSTASKVSWPEFFEFQSMAYSHGKYISGSHY